MQTTKNIFIPYGTTYNDLLKELPEYLFELFFNRFGRNRKSHDLILFFLREHPSISVADEVTRELQATVNKWIEGEDRPVNKLQ